MIATILFSLLLVSLNTVGQLLLKQATLTLGTYKAIYLGAGYFCFLIAIVSSYFLMKVMALQYFTVIMSMNYLTILFASAYCFKERVSRSKLVGVLIVVVGIVVFVMDSSL